MPNGPAGSMRAVSSVFQGANDAFPKAFHAFSFPSPKIAVDFAHIKNPDPFSGLGFLVSFFKDSFRLRNS